MCGAHVSTQEDTQEVPSGHALVFQQAACNEEKVSIDSRLNEHVLVGFCSGPKLAWAGTHASGCPNACQCGL